MKLAIGLLIKEGELDSSYTNLHRKETEEKLKRILNMVKAKRKVGEISRDLELSLDTVYSYIDRLIEEGFLSVAEAEQCVDEEIERRVTELRNAGLGQDEIMAEMHITRNTLRRVLDKLSSEGKIATYKQVDKTKIRIVELSKCGYNAAEISRQLRKDKTKIENLLNELMREGLIAQEEIKQARDAKKKEIVELIRQRKVRKDIILEVGV